MRGLKTAVRATESVSATRWGRTPEGPTARLWGEGFQPFLDDLVEDSSFHSELMILRINPAPTLFGF